MTSFPAIGRLMTVAFTNVVNLKPTVLFAAILALMGIEDDSTLMWFLFVCIAVLLVLGVLGWLFG